MLSRNLLMSAMLLSLYGFKNANAMFTNPFKGRYTCTRCHKTKFILKFTQCDECEEDVRFKCAVQGAIRADKMSGNEYKYQYALVEECFNRQGKQWETLKQADKKQMVTLLNERNLTGCIEKLAELNVERIAEAEKAKTDARHRKKADDFMANMRIHQQARQRTTADDFMADLRRNKEARQREAAADFMLRTQKARQRAAADFMLRNQKARQRAADVEEFRAECIGNRDDQTTRRRPTCPRTRRARQIKDLQNKTKEDTEKADRVAWALEYAFPQCIKVRKDPEGFESKLMAMSLDDLIKLQGKSNANNWDVVKAFKPKE